MNDDLLGIVFRFKKKEEEFCLGWDFFYIFFILLGNKVVFLFFLDF